MSRTIKMRMEQLRKMVMNIGSEFRGLEERIHRGEKVRKSEITKVENEAQYSGYITTRTRERRPKKWMDFVKKVK